MPSLYQNIRGALQERAATAAGFPSAPNVAYEGRHFDPPAATAGAVWARMVLSPSGRSSFDVANKSRRALGVFTVSLFYAAAGDPGTGPVEALADAVIAALPPGARLFKNGAGVKIDASERLVGVLPDQGDGWLHCPVSVRWHCFSNA